MLPQLGHFRCTYCTFAKFPVPCYQMFSVTVTDICIGCHGHRLQLPTSPCSFSDVRGSVAYIFYTLWQYLEFIEEQLGPVRNVVTLDCLPRPGCRLQTSHNTKLPDDETNKMYFSLAASCWAAHSFIFLNGSKNEHLIIRMNTPLFSADQLPASLCVLTIEAAVFPLQCHCYIYCSSPRTV